VKPVNEHTAFGQRFFFPEFGEVECHESVDLANLPGVVHIGNGEGHNNFVVYETEEGDEEAQELTRLAHTLPAGATILQVRSLAHYAGTSPPSFMRDEEVSLYLGDDTLCYVPHSEEGLLSIIQLNLGGICGELADPRFDDKGIALLPVSEPLPVLPDANLRKSTSNAQYNLLGFITSADKLVSWTGPTYYTTQLVDWCVANTLRQNGLEAYLLENALPSEGHLVGLLNTDRSALAYLRFYDTKHKTHFVPEEDPRRQDTRAFPALTAAEQARLRGLIALQHADLR
jgi:hypothetical protein